MYSTKSIGNKINSERKSNYNVNYIFNVFKEKIYKMQVKT